MAFNVLVPISFGNLANFLPLHYIIVSVHILQQIYLHFAKTSKRQLLFLATKMSLKNSLCLLTFLAWQSTLTISSPESPMSASFYFFPTSSLQPYLKFKTLSLNSSRINFSFHLLELLRFEFSKQACRRLKLRRGRKVQWKGSNLSSNLVLTHIIYSFKGCFLSGQKTLQDCVGEQIRETGAKLKLKKNLHWECLPSGRSTPTTDPCIHFITGLARGA